MRSNLRWIVIGVAAAALIGLFVVLRPGADEAEPAAASSPTPSPTAAASPTPDHDEPAEPDDDASDGGSGTAHDDAVIVKVRDGKVRGGAKEVVVKQGDVVHAWVTADVADEVHVHGFDLRFDVEPDEPAHVEFAATAPGIYEVELEGTHLLLFTVRVEP